MPTKAKWVIGNWKLNPDTTQAAASLAVAIAQQAQQVVDGKEVSLMLVPTTLHLSTVAQYVADLQGHETSHERKCHESRATHETPSKKGMTVALGVQDISALSAHTGAFTGEISAELVKQAGAQWVLIGHSERRQLAGDDEQILAQKLRHALSTGLGVILCIGETEADYIAGRTLAVLEAQLNLLKNINVANDHNDDDSVQRAQSHVHMGQHLIIAYEPVWAIGTGRVPSTDEVAKVHQHISQTLNKLNPAFDAVSVLYGGSVKPDNARDFAMTAGVDGVLVGGASLKAADFLAIAQAFA